jgi:aminopeptidase
MTDTRLTQYAQLLVDTCLEVEAGWEVLVASSPLARPLGEEVARALAHRGAYVHLRLSFGGQLAPAAWVNTAPLELVSRLSDIDRHQFERADAFIQIMAPENTREVSAVPAERLVALQTAYEPALARLAGGDVPWVGCQFPTPALAQEAGMATGEFAEFLYGACLLDWGAEHRRMQAYADRFDQASEVRIVGDGTDLQLSIEGRTMHVDAGGANIPGGEFFTSPIEDSAEGEVVFSEFPAVYAGRELNRIRLRFEAGRVVDASADTNEAFLLETLDSDEGARRLGEIGIGCNPGITRYMRNTLFDEKIDGTVHLALGRSIGVTGGVNESQIHWDLVKDLRVTGSRLELDGEIVQQDGCWLIG